MKYYINAHACHYFNELINIDITLYFYASEGECIVVTQGFLDNICSATNEYGPLFNNSTKSLFTKPPTSQYHQIEFGREADDPVESIIYCCGRDSSRDRGDVYGEIYDFINGDLSLSQVIDLLKLHDSIHGDSTPIELYIFSCNKECDSPPGPNYGVKLTKKVKNDPTYFSEPGAKVKVENVANSRKRSRTLRNTLFMERYKPTPIRQMKQILKEGNYVIKKDNLKKYKITMKNKKLYINNDPLKQKEVYFVAPIHIGDHVMHKRKIIGTFPVQYNTVICMVTGKRKERNHITLKIVDINTDIVEYVNQATVVKIPHHF